MKDHKNSRRTFYVYNEAWYSKNTPLPNRYTDEVMFSLDAKDGGTHGEMGMRWMEVGGKSTPRLECFCDGWGALYTFSDLLAELAKVDGHDITPKLFCEILIRCGFEDKTQRTSPYAGGNNENR